MPFVDLIKLPRRIDIPAVNRARQWWRRLTPSRQDWVAMLAPLAAVVLFMAAIVAALGYLQLEEMDREQEAVQRDVEYTQQRLRLRLIERQEQLGRVARAGVRARYGAVSRSLKALVAGAAAIVLAAASAGARIRAVQRGGSIAGAASERRHADTGAIGRAGAVPRARHRAEVVHGEVARWPTKATVADAPSVVAEATHACRRAHAGCSGATGDEESYHRAPLSNRWAA